MLYLYADGRVFAAGKNDCGQCGFAGAQFTNELVQVEFEGREQGDQIVGVSCGSHFNYAVSALGRCWS